jgi:hypothetical protein
LCFVVLYLETHVFNAFECFVNFVPWNPWTIWDVMSCTFMHTWQNSTVLDANNDVDFCLEQNLCRLALNPSSFFSLTVLSKRWREGFLVAIRSTTIMKTVDLTFISKFLPSMVLFSSVLSTVLFLQ